jgi:hypothetical protein
MVGAGIMLAITGLAVSLFVKYRTIFFYTTNFGKFQPLFTPGPGRLISLAVIATLAAGTVGLIVKAFSLSRRLACWVDAVVDSFALVMIAMVLRQHYTDFFAVRIPISLEHQAWIYSTLTVTLLVVSVFVAIDLVANVVRLGRRRPTA